MKLRTLFTTVITVHILAIGLVAVFPGCQIRPQGDRADPNTPFGQPHRPTTPAVASDAPTTAPTQQTSGHRPPTRPTWNIAAEADPEPIMATDSTYRQTDFNAFPDVEEVSFVVGEEEETVVTPDPSRDRGLAQSRTYTVVAGDNLTRIARAQNVALSDLMAANQLDRNSIIRVGQVLVIPDGSERVGPQAPSARTPEPVEMGVEGSRYEVQRGDTLGSIARRYGTTVEALRSANNLPGTTIYVGQDLLIPSGDQPLPPPPARTAPPSVETRSGESTHQVSSGETLESIARRHGVTVRDLATRNQIQDPRRLQVGTVLIIPASGSRAETPTPTPAPRPVAPAPTAPAPHPPSAPTTPDFDFDDFDDAPLVPVESTN